MVEIVNVVGSGALDIELKLERLATDIGKPRARYDPNKYPGMYLELEEDLPLVTVYRTGKYIVTGADSGEECFATRDQFLTLFSDMDVLEYATDEWFSLQNFVCVDQLEQNLNLNALAIGLGLEQTEYEPEQFPGLIYRPEESECVILLFASGRVVLTGCQSVNVAEQAFDDLVETVSTFL